jgi:dihydrofolate reductase
VTISIIVAMDRERGIGKNNTLPWRLSSDLKRFKRLTMGHHLLMGRRTFESIGKPLPGRQTIILTRQAYRQEGCLIAESFEQAVEIARAAGEQELFVCGGSQVYAEAIGRTDRIYLTLVHSITGADTFFPAMDDSSWLETETIDHPAGPGDEYPFTFKLLERRPIS